MVDNNKDSVTFRGRNPVYRLNIAGSPVNDL